jgi:hypothetical protein
MSEEEDYRTMIEYLHENTIEDSIGFRILSTLC